MLFSENSKLYRFCDKLVMALVCILMADCAIFGSGRILSVGPLGFRTILLCLTLLLSVPLILSQFRILLQRRLLWLLGVFFVWLMLQTIVGIRNQNNTSLLLSDLKGFFHFFAVLPCLCVFKTKDRVHRLMRVVMYASAALAAVAFLLLFIYNWAPTAFNRIGILDKDHDITMFAAVSSKIPRLFFKSTPYLLCGCVFAVYFYTATPGGKHRWQYPLIIGFSLFALLLSYTRSIYLGAGISAIFLTVMLYCGFDNAHRMCLKKILAASVLICIVLITLCSTILSANYFGYALDRVGITFFQPDDSSSGSADPSEPSLPPEDNPNDYQQQTIAADKLRAETLSELLTHIKSAPVLGHGLGKSLAVRNHLPHEYIYLDFWMKTGIIGLLLYFAPFLTMLLNTIKRCNNGGSKTQLLPYWLSALLGFIIFSFFNPYMNAALGILLYCCSISLFYLNDTPNQPLNH